MKITIPNACYENWDAMSPDEKGKFCTVCSKKVTDFRNDSDEEIISFIESTEENICGTFSENQLGKNLHHSYINSLFTKFAVGFFLTSGGVITANAQQKQEICKPVARPQIMGKMVAIKKPKPAIQQNNGRLFGETVAENRNIDTPLYFLNGVEVSEKMVKNLKPDAINKMIVWTPEAAMAKYGVRAKNGAVIIKTE